MTNKKLVSILVPSYNAEKYITNLLKSILMQTYPNIETIIIDDGSTDGSAKIIKSYVPKFNKKGYELKYVYQKNQGQSVAINNGLKLIKGDYLLWPDADDYYSSRTAINKMANVLYESDDSVSSVRVQYKIVTEDGKIINRVRANNKTRYKTDVFEDRLFCYGSDTCPIAGNCMVKVSKIDELIPGREIYTEKKAGQNLQLLLPLLYKNKCLAIEEYLFNVVARNNSHSRNRVNNDNIQTTHYRVLKKVLDEISLESDYKKYLIKKYKELYKRTLVQKQSRIRVRAVIKQGIKLLTPYGIVMLYKRGVSK